jgi:ubiquinone/menaquinone biosynthesis C-methylase UbiE
MQPLEWWGLTRLRKVTLAELPEGMRLLEVGAGTGLNFRFYPRLASGVASELSFKMLSIASEKQERPRDVKLVQSAAERLPFSNDAFDAAFATLAFCSVESPQRGFMELRRVVKSGGKVVLLEHVRPQGLLGYLFDALNLVTATLFEDHCNRRTADEACRAGLEVMRVENYLFGVVQIIVCRIA